MYLFLLVDPNSFLRVMCTVFNTSIPAQIVVQSCPNFIFGGFRTFWEKLHIPIFIYLKGKKSIFELFAKKNLKKLQFFWSKGVTWCQFILSRPIKLKLRRYWILYIITEYGNFITWPIFDHLKNLTPIFIIPFFSENRFFPCENLSV